MPAYTNPVDGVIDWIFWYSSKSTSVVDTFLSQAMTTPFVALIPKAIFPWPTLFKAYSIWSSLPLLLNVVKLKFMSLMVAPVVDVASTRTGGILGLEFVCVKVLHIS